MFMVPFEFCRHSRNVTDLLRISGLHIRKLERPSNAETSLTMKQVRWGQKILRLAKSSAIEIHPDRLLHAEFISRFVTSTVEIVRFLHPNF